MAQRPMKSPAARANSHQDRGHQKAANGRDRERARCEGHREGACRTKASALRDEGASRDADQRPHIDQGETADQHYERELTVVLRRERARQSHIQPEAESALEALAPEHDGEAPPGPMQPGDHDAPSPADRLSAPPTVSEPPRVRTATRAALMAAATGDLANKAS